MKRIIFVLFAAMVLQVSGQTDSSLLRLTRLDFAVPEHPAFSILESNPGNILRPGNSAEIVSLIYSDFLVGKTPVIPKDLSIEFSPAQLIGINKITFEDYKKNGKRILYDSKISIGTSISDDGRDVNNFAVGLRLTWVDKSALSADPEFVKSVCKELVLDAASWKDFVDSLISNSHQFNGKVITEDDVAKNETPLYQYVNNLYHEHLKKVEIENNNKNAVRRISIKALREKYKNANWNKFKFESAAAVRFNSADSLIAHSHYSRFSLYNSLAFPLGKSGQCIVGLNYSHLSFDSLHITVIDEHTQLLDTVHHSVSVATLASRAYFGVNKFKMFLEGSGKYLTDDRLQLGINVGGEFNVYDGLWAMVNFGNNWIKSIESGASDKWQNGWYWGLDLRFRIPEKAKL